MEVSRWSRTSQGERDSLAAAWAVLTEVSDTVLCSVLCIAEGGGSLAGVLACLRLTHEAHLKDLVL